MVPEPREEGSDVAQTFRAEYSASLLSVYQPVRVSVLITTYYKTKRLWWVLKDELILQGGLIWCPLSRILVLGSLLRSMTYPATVDSTRHALHFVEWALISRPKKVIGYFHNICATIWAGILY